MFSILECGKSDKEKQIKLIYTGENQLALFVLFIPRKYQQQTPHTHTEYSVTLFFFIVPYTIMVYTKFYKLPNKHMCNALISVNNA